MPQPIDRLKDYVLCALALGASPRAICSILWKETKNIRVRLHLAAHRPDDIYSLQTIYGPLYFRDNFGDITNLVSLFYHQVYRVRTLTHEGPILDVGANVGLAAAWFAHHNPDRAIYCFEPVAATAALIALNCPAAKVECVALGASRRRVTLHLDRHNVMASRIPCRWETRHVEFDAMSLDEFAEAKGLGQVGLIKIDAEGMEVEILEGGKQTLNYTQQLVMETHGRSSHDKVIRHLQRAGFCLDSEQFLETIGLVFASRH